MATKRRVPGPDGQPVDGTVVGFRTGYENWNEYLLDDGTVVSLKLVVTEVVRIDSLKDDLGQPVYMVKSSNVMNVSAPDESE